MDTNTQRLVQSLAMTNDNLATHVLALTAIVGALSEDAKPDRRRVMQWCQALTRGQSAIDGKQIEAVANGILNGPTHVSRPAGTA